MWNKELVQQLIINYQQHENLYNVRDPQYSDRVKRSNSVFKICNETETDLVDRLDSVKSLIDSNLQEKTEYEWWGKQVVLEMNPLQNPGIQRETAWKVQSIPREASVEYTARSNIMPQTLSSGYPSSTLSASNTVSPQERTSFSGILENTSYSYSPVFLQTATQSYSTSPDILSQSLEGILEDADF